MIRPSSVEKEKCRFLPWEYICSFSLTTAKYYSHLLLTPQKGYDMSMECIQAVYTISLFMIDEMKKEDAVLQRKPLNLKQFGQTYCPQSFSGGGLYSK